MPTQNEPNTVTNSVRDAATLRGRVRVLCNHPSTIARVLRLALPTGFEPVPPP